MAATDDVGLRSDVQESQNTSPEALQSASAPGARSVVRDLDEADNMDSAGVPGSEFVAEELIVHIIPKKDDEFTCHSCFLVRHSSRLGREKNGHANCTECEG